MKINRFYKAFIAKKIFLIFITFDFYCKDYFKIIINSIRYSRIILYTKISDNKTYFKKL